MPTADVSSLPVRDRLLMNARLLRRKRSFLLNSINWRTLLSAATIKLVVPTVQGAFNLYIKLSFYAAIFFAVPFLLVQVWGFVAPGLYPHEKKYAAPIIIMALGVFPERMCVRILHRVPASGEFSAGGGDGRKPETVSHRR